MADRGKDSGRNALAKTSDQENEIRAKKTSGQVLGSGQIKGKVRVTGEDPRWSGCVDPEACS